MNSALKPVLAPTGPQNAAASGQLGGAKPMMHAGAAVTGAGGVGTTPTPPVYGQPSQQQQPPSQSQPQQYGNPHVHPNPAHQSNHYPTSLNVAGTTAATYNPSILPPVSNHPVASTPTTTNISQQQQQQQSYATPKSMQYATAFQPSIAHLPNPNPIPPVCQTLPPTQPLPESKVSNGTSEVKSPEPPPALSPSSSSLQKTDTTSDGSQKDKCTGKDEKDGNVSGQQDDAMIESAPSPSPTSESSVVVQNLATASSGKATLTTSSASSSPGGSEMEITPPSKSMEDEKVFEKDDDDDEEEGESEEVVSDPATIGGTQTPKKEQKSPPTKPPITSTPSTTLLRTPTRKPRAVKSDNEMSITPPTKKSDSTKSSPNQKSPGSSTGGKSKRTRIKTQPYQCPLPEMEIITKISSTTPRNKQNDDKLIVFYKNEFLAVRNLEGSFYICQAVQNIYKSSPKIRIRWLSQDKNEKSGETFTPDFYDHTDFDCILTNLNLERIDKGKYRLPPTEKKRTDSILKRSLAVEKGEVTSPSLTEEHPDGIDVSIYKEESQLKKRKRGTKRRARSAMKLTTDGSGSSDPKKTPDKSKTRRMASAGATPVTAVKTSPRRSGKKRNAARKSTVTSSVGVEAKKLPSTMGTTTSTTASPGTTRTDRAKRRSDNQNHNKVTPVVDQKKAKVLAKVARKTAVSSTAQAPTKNPTTPARSARGTKSTSSSATVSKATAKTNKRRGKRSKKK